MRGRLAVAEPTVVRPPPTAFRATRAGGLAAARL